ncbi:putative transposase [Burkholderia mallei]|nr:putative transposase [Burkholderia mallei]
MNSKSTAASIWRSRWSFGTSSSSVTISSSCCVGMGVFSITPLKNKNPPLGEGLSAIWTRLRGGFFFARLARPRRGPASCAARERTEDAPTMHRRCADRLPGESCGRPPGGPRAITLRAIGSIETIMR